LKSQVDFEGFLFGVDQNGNADLFQLENA
jgi:hypothetical protein